MNLLILLRACLTVGWFAFVETSEITHRCVEGSCDEPDISNNMLQHSAKLAALEHIGSKRDLVGIGGSFPDWYYGKANQDGSECTMPEKHIFSDHISSMLRSVDAFFKEQGVKYSLWGGSLLAVARARQHNITSMSMPWDFDIDIITTHNDFIQLAKRAKNIKERPYKTAEERKESAKGLDEAMHDMDDEFTLLNDNMLRIAAKSYAHGDMKTKWYPKLMEEAAAAKDADLNLDSIMQPGRYGDILNYKHIDAEDKVEPCELEGVMVSCLSDAFTYSSSDATAQLDAEKLWKKMPYGSDSNGFLWEQPDHLWDQESCGYKCAGGKACVPMKNNMLITAGVL